MKKTPEFTLKKTENDKTPRYTKCLKKVKIKREKLKCTLLALAHRKLKYYALFA